MRFKSLNYILTGIVLMVLISCNGNKQATPAVNDNAAASAGNPKIVFVNIDTLLSRYNLYIDKKADLEAQSKVAEKSLAGKLEAFRRRAAQFQQEIAAIQQKANTIAPVELKRIMQHWTWINNFRKLRKTCNQKLMIFCLKLLMKKDMIWYL